MYIGSERAERVLDRLPESIRQSVASRYKAESVNKNTDPKIISKAGKVLKRSGFFGEKVAKAITDELDESIPCRLTVDECETYFETNPIITFNAERYIVKFEDIPQLSDMCIQKVLREIDATEAAKALKGASEDIRDKFFRNMSTRAAGALQEDDIGPYRFRLPKNSYQLCEIGNAMHNCVASYVDLILQGRCTIVTASRDGEYRICIETYQNKIRQELTGYNAPPNPEECEILKQWHERHGLI